MECKLGNSVALEDLECEGVFTILSFALYWNGDRCCNIFHRESKPGLDVDYMMFKSSYQGSRAVGI